jgi:hypothetical protein
VRQLTLWKGVKDTVPATRGLHSSTIRLNVSAFCGIGGALQGFYGVFRRCQGVRRGRLAGGFCQTAQVELKSGRV